MVLAAEAGVAVVELDKSVLRALFKEWDAEVILDFIRVESEKVGKTPFANASCIVNEIVRKFAPKKGEVNFFSKSDKWEVQLLVSKYWEKWFLKDFEKYLSLIKSLSENEDWMIREVAQVRLRKFISVHKIRALKTLESWLLVENEFVRRCAAEALRPVGFGKWLKDYPSVVLDLLERVKSDRSLYVRKSVKNCIIDISRFNSNAVTERLGCWVESGNFLTKWTCIYSLNYLIKKRDEKARELLDRLCMVGSFRIKKLASKRLQVYNLNMQSV